MVPFMVVLRERQTRTNSELSLRPTFTASRAAEGPRDRRADQFIVVAVSAGTGTAEAALARI